MGTWISHLRIAENLLPYLPGVDEVAFAYGSLAPDSGRPNADWTAFDPPKEVTHFLYRGEGENNIRDYLFYQQYLAPVMASVDNLLYSFRLGYFFHLLSDSLWSRKIGTTTVKAYEKEISSDAGQAWDNIKADWYGLDHLYVQARRECLFWRVIATGDWPPSRLPYISDAAYHQQLDYIRKFYSQPEPEWLAPRRYPYLNGKTMERIIADSTNTLVQIWEQHPCFEELSISETALTLLPDEALQPYEMPLGDEL